MNNPNNMPAPYQQAQVPVNAPPGFARSEAPPPSMGQAARDEMARSYDGPGGGGTSVDWFDFPMPKSMGQTTETILRILPAKEAGKRFWSRTELHFGRETTDDGREKRIAWDCGAIEGHRCPGTEKRVEAFTRAKQLGETRDNPGPNRQLGFSLGTKSRYFFNAIILSDPHRHWRDGQLWPCVIRGNKAFSEAVLNLEQYQGPISDWQWGFNIVVKIKKIGPENWQVDYDQVGVYGDRCQIEEQWWPVLGNLYDLDELVSPKSPSEELVMFQRCWPEHFGAAPATVDITPPPAAMPPIHSPAPQMAPPQQPQRQPMAPPQATPFTSAGTATGAFSASGPVVTMPPQFDTTPDSDDVPF